MYWSLKFRTDGVKVNKLTYLFKLCCIGWQKHGQVLIFAKFRTECLKHGITDLSKLHVYSKSFFYLKLSISILYNILNIGIYYESML